VCCLISPVEGEATRSSVLSKPPSERSKIKVLLIWKQKVRYGLSQETLAPRTTQPYHGHRPAPSCGRYAGSLARAAARTAFNPPSCPKPELRLGYSGVLGSGRPENGRRTLSCGFGSRVAVPRPDAVTCSDHRYRSRRRSAMLPAPSTAHSHTQMRRLQRRSGGPQ
jgi:hypothetical protein